MIKEINWKKPIELTDGTPAIFNRFDEKGFAIVNIETESTGPFGEKYDYVFTTTGFHFFSKLPPVRNR